MTETATVPGVERYPLTDASVYVGTITSRAAEPLLVAPHHGSFRLLLIGAAVSLTSNEVVESDLLAFTELRARSSQVTDSRIVADDEGPEARQVRRAALYRLRAEQLRPEERVQRIIKALAALHAPNPLPRVDRAIWKWAAEDPDLEDL